MEIVRRFGGRICGAKRIMRGRVRSRANRSTNGALNMSETEWKSESEYGDEVERMLPGGLRR
ncbi:hypothetical protein HanHA300_Chr12g0442401 [Helianthus annuus]|nr:hypothetical protein HanHA300_Chr12g0442401 [Helianthus annuus]KAJ0505177.1 hypothetical protein HanHA89_Chr12g0467501 [Helianthus annuus]